jgi:hypothetical protein
MLACPALPHTSLHLRNAGPEFRLRDETLETLGELVQHGIVLQLQRPLNLLAFGEGGSYYNMYCNANFDQTTAAQEEDRLECLPSDWR